MERKLLLCDIGNTSIKLGLANEKRVLTSYGLPAQHDATADSLGLNLLSVLNHAGEDPHGITACAVSSVVPAIDPVLREAVARYVGCPVLFAPSDLHVPLENRYERPDEVGADRLVGSFAARRLYPAATSLIVVDFGTAVTFDCVSGDAYLGGLIFPGPYTAAAALASHTARLPHVNFDIRAPDPSPGRDTSTSIQHGLVFGFVSVTEGLCNRLKRQLSGPVKVLATGGFANSIARISPIFDAVLPALLLEGLRRLYFEDKQDQF